MQIFLPTSLNFKFNLFSIKNAHKYYRESCRELTVNKMKVFHNCESYEMEGNYDAWRKGMGFHANLNTNFLTSENRSPIFQ